MTAPINVGAIYQKFLANDDFMREYRRDTGSTLGMCKPPRLRILEIAFGYHEAELQKFKEYVRKVLIELYKREKPNV